MTDVNWLQVGLAAFGGAFLTQLCTIIWNIRKERIDKENAINLKLAEHHMRRINNLAAILGHIAEARWCYALLQDIKRGGEPKLENDDVQDHRSRRNEYFDSFKEVSQRASKSIINAMVESDLYRKLPPEYFMTADRLGTYLQMSLLNKIDNCNQYLSTADEYEEGNNHVILLSRDLRVLMEFELKKYSHVGDKKFKPTLLDIPYLRKLQEIAPNSPLTVDDVEYNHMS